MKLCRYHAHEITRSKIISEHYQCHFALNRVLSFKSVQRKTLRLASIIFSDFMCYSDIYFLKPSDGGRLELLQKRGNVLQFILHWKQIFTTESGPLITTCFGYFYKHVGDLIMI